jgi:hypothetical protein
VSVFTALTGFWDWLKSTEPATQARRTANAHAVTMLTVTLLVVAGIAVRVFAFWDEDSTPGLALALTLVAAALTVLGGTLGGELAYDYGFNVETAGDHPVWHPSEVDVFPGSSAQSGGTASGAAANDERGDATTSQRPQPPVTSP